MSPATLPNRQTITAWAAIALAAALIMLPAAFRPMMMHDSFWIDHVWASQFTELLREGVLYPRWLPWSHEGLGSPVFYYYPPLAFYISGAFGLLGLSTYGSILATFELAYFVSGVGAYHWLRGRSQYPLLGALFFVLAPYHCFDFYVRGALAESVAIAILPLLAIGLRRIAEGRGWAFAAAAYAAIILTHLPLALLASIFLVAPYALVHRRRLAGFAAACAVGIGLSAIYLLPAIALEPFRDAAQLWATPFLRPSFWTLFAGNWQVAFFIYVQLTIAVLAIPTLIFALKARDRWAMYAVAILAVALGLVPFLWSLPLLRDVQFAYRILPLAELGLAAAFARASISTPTRAALLALPLIWAGVLVQLDRGPGQSPEAVNWRHQDVTEFLPPGVQDPANRKHWLAEPRKGRVPPPVIDGWIVKLDFYFPSWSCGKIEPQTKLLMHRPGCEPRIEMTIYEKIGGLISFAALIALLFGCFVRRGSISKGPRQQAASDP